MKAIRTAIKPFLLLLAAATMMLPGPMPAASLAKESSESLEGFDPGGPKSALYTDKYENYEGKPTPSLWEYPLDGSLAVTWTSPSVPDSLRGKPVMFAIQAGLGASKGTNSWHELSVNGNKIVRFNAPYGEKLVWQDHGCTITFHSLRVDENDDLMGVMHLEIAPEYIHYGQPQTFAVQGENNNSKGWFMLFEGAALAGDVVEVQRKNEVARRIANIKNTVVPPDASPEYIAKWRGRKSAAWSASSAPVSSPDAVNVRVAGKTESALRLEIENAIAGQRWINEVYPDQQALRNIPPEHSEWLKKLDCVLWLSDAEEIQRYAKLRNELKATVVKEDESRLLVTLPPSEAAIPVTVQIPLSKSVWGAEVSIDGVQVGAEYIYLKEDKGISFDLQAGQSAKICLNQ
jgi:hypothetical protein